MAGRFFGTDATDCLPKGEIIVHLPLLFEYAMLITTNFCSFVITDISQNIKGIDFTSSTKSIQTFYRCTLLS